MQKKIKTHSPVITIANQKGGVGKTTTTVNVATAFSLKGLKTLVVDLDPQCNTTLLLSKKNHNKTIREALSNHICIYRTRYNNLDIIQGSPDLVQTDVTEVNAFKKIFELTPDYDVIIVDTSPTWETITFSAVAASDLIVTPIILDAFALASLPAVKNALQEFGSETMTKWKVLINAYKSKSSGQRETFTKLRGQDEFPMLESAISSSSLITNAFTIAKPYPKPVLKYRSTSNASMEYMALAEELINALEERRSTNG